MTNVIQLCAYICLILNVSETISQRLDSMGCATMPDILSRTTRIQNGFQTKGPLPYQLRLDYRGYRYCGATLISSKYAITAGHCLLIKTIFGLRPADISKFEVVAGAYKKREHGQRRRIKSITKPYDAEYWYWPLPDLVILELETPFDLMKGKIQPACLPSKDIELGRNCYVSGWGEGSGNFLNALEMKINKCGPDDDLDNDDNFFCLLSKIGSACYGDSGGPMICEENDKAVFYGVASAVTDKRCRENFVNIYANVYQHIELIESALKNDPKYCNGKFHSKFSWLGDGICDNGLLNNKENCFDGGDCDRKL